MRPLIKEHLGDILPVLAHFSITSNPVGCVPVFRAVWSSPHSIAREPPGADYSAMAQSIEITTQDLLDIAQHLIRVNEKRNRAVERILEIVAASKGDNMHAIYEAAHKFRRKMRESPYG